MKSSEIRTRFLKFFEARGHRVLPSSSLVPAHDPTLLFSNAGMNQFKDVFLGREKRDYSRAATSQKCVRAGGKHNDLEQVGRTTRHHTFFEMLGNFSFGDYFKKEAIPWAWELITREFAIPREQLYVTTFLGSGSGPDDHDVVPHDDEAHDLWVALGVGNDRIVELGLKDNFWQMGDTGPCGPCSEIHYDLGPGASDLGHTECKFPCDCGRFVEIWNLVFMQYSRYCRYERDGYPAHWDEKARAEHKHSDDRYACLALDLLPKPCVDTGMGLERVAAVLQGKKSNYDTDLFQPLIEEAAGLANVEYGSNHDTDVSLRIIADHARAATFLISDGVLPSNEGRGYVLRLIMRRALYHGQTLGLNEPFLYKMSGHVVQMMKDAYPELLATAHHVAKAIKIEEEQYARTVRIGLEKLEEARVVLDDGRVATLGNWKNHYSSHGKDMGKASPLDVLIEGLPGAQSLFPLPPKGVGWIYGDDLFELHDTFGLRPEFVEDIVKNYGLTVDWDGYKLSMAEQRMRARASWKGAEKKVALPAFLKLAEDGKTVFDGYTQTTSTDCRVEALVVKGESVAEVKPGSEVEIVLDHTPFYAEAGGQVGDTGFVFAPASDRELAHVTNTYYPVSGLIAHRAVARDRLRVGDLVTAQVDVERREATRRNHTATHLLHAALRKTLGTHVKQAGSLVAPDRLRFDFTHYAALDEQDLLDIEDLVNEHILKNEVVATEEKDLDSAVAGGAMALFGEKYADKVRVLSINDFSKELCGGTHVRRTGDIGLFKIVSESSVAAGTRRIEAVTGEGVLKYLRQASETLALLADSLHAKPEELLQAVEKLSDSEKKLRKELEGQQMKRATSQASDLVKEAREVKGVRVVAARVEVTDRSAMRQMVDDLRAKLQSGVIVLGSVSDGKVSLVAAVTKDLTNKLDAGKIVKQAAAYVEGSGGGRKDLAEAGGKNPAKLDESLQAVPSIVEAMLSVVS
jgi:alanyl-tRNA synthetase